MLPEFVGMDVLGRNLYEADFARWEGVMYVRRISTDADHDVLYIAVEPDKKEQLIEKFRVFSNVDEVRITTLRHKD